MRITSTIARITLALTVSLGVLLTVSPPAELPIVGIELAIDVHLDGNTWG